MDKIYPQQILESRIKISLADPNAHTYKHFAILYAEHAKLHNWYSQKFEEFTSLYSVAVTCYRLREETTGM